MEQEYVVEPRLSTLVQHMSNLFYPVTTSIQIIMFVPENPWKYCLLHKLNTSLFFLTNGEPLKICSRHFKLCCLHKKPNIT